MLRHSFFLYALTAELSSLFFILVRIINSVYQKKIIIRVRFMNVRFQIYIYAFL